MTQIGQSPQLQSSDLEPKSTTSFEGVDIQIDNSYHSIDTNGFY